MTSVARLRLQPGEVEPTVAEVRRLVAEREHVEPTWWVGSSATPHDLVERLLALGFVPRTQPTWEPHCTAMALVEEPQASEGIVVRGVESPADYRQVLEVEWEAFGTPEADRIQGRLDAPAEFEAMIRDGSMLAYLAEADGRPIASALAVPADAGLLMIGGGVVRSARSRGAYRALVRARWDDAVARGTPALVAQAGAMSEPILRRLGFVVVAEVQVLLDAGFRAGRNPHRGSPRAAVRSALTTDPDS